MVNLHIIDGSNCQSLPKEINAGLQKYNLLESGNLSFCGIAVIAGQTIFSFPKNYEPLHRAANFQKQDELNLFKTLLRFSGNYIASFSDGYSNDEPEMNSMLKILENYRKYGLYKTRSISQSNESGNINWKDTVQKEQVHFSSNLLPVFGRLVRTKPSQSSQNELCLIQVTAITQILSQVPCLMYLLGLKKLPPINIEKHMAYDDQVILRRLKIIKSRSKDNRTKYLCSLLQSYFSRENIGSEGVLIGVKKFESLWEMILKKVVGETKKQEFPAISYETVKGTWSIKRGTKLQPDIITEDIESGTLNIYDAKYYTANELNKLPGSGDYIKQNYYKAILAKIFPKKTITNSFVFPGRKKHWNAVKFDVHAEEDEIMFSKVDCLFIDVGAIMEKFNRSEISPNFGSLLSK